jgi:hypothetical protein
VPQLFSFALPTLRAVPPAAAGRDRGLLALAGLALAFVALGGGVVAAGAGRSVREA